jgi:hypothetical protein
MPAEPTPMVSRIYIIYIYHRNHRTYLSRIVLLRRLIIFPYVAHALHLFTFTIVSSLEISSVDVTRESGSSSDSFRPTHTAKAALFFATMAFRDVVAYGFFFLFG